MPFDISTAVEATNTNIPTTPFDITTAQEADQPPKSVSPFSQFLRNIFKSSPIEEIQTANFELQNAESLPKAVSGESYRDYAKRWNAFLQPRENEIANEGVLRQVEAPMALAIGVQGVAQPVKTAAQVGGYALMDNFFNARQALPENANPILKDVVELADFTVKAAILGGGAGAFENAKRFTLDRMDKLNMPKAVDIPSDQISELKKNDTVMQALEIAPEQIKASEASGLPLSVPVEKVLNLADTSDWASLRETIDPASVPPKEQIPVAEIVPKEKIRGLSQSTEESAIEQGLKEDINPSLPRYQVRPINKIAADLSKYLDENYQEAHNVLDGKAEVPNGFREEEIYSAVRSRAMKEGDFKTLKELAQSDFVSSMATEAGQRIKALDVGGERNPVKDMQEVIAERGKTDDAKLKAAKTRLANAQKKLEDKINQLNFETDPRKKTELDTEAKRLKEEVDSLRRVFESGKKVKGKIKDEEAKNLVNFSKDILDKERIMNDSARRGNSEGATPQELDYGLSLVAYDNYFNELKFGKPKIDLEQYKQNPKKFLYDVTGITKSLASSLDNSFIGRQGIKLFYKGMTGDIPSGKIWLDTFNKSFQTIWDTFGGKPVMNYLRAEILSDPMFPLLKKAGIDTAVTEEAFPTSLVTHVPIVGKPFEASENAFTASAHYMRYKLGKLEFEIAQNAGVDLKDDAQLKSIGKLVNSLTGRGDLGGKTKTPGILNNVFFSPRFIKSHIDFLTAHQFDTASPYIKKRAATNLLRVIVGQAMILGVAKIIDPDSVETDPHSADFGKIKVGNTRFDISGGAASFITLAARLLPVIFGQKSYTKSSVSGKKKELNTGRFGQTTGVDVLNNFLENKTSPLARTILDNLAGKDMSGKEPSLLSSAENLITPLPIKNAQEMMSDPNSANLIVGIIADGLGISTNTYGNKKSPKF